jgi:hypothetical protein
MALTFQLPDGMLGRFGVIKLWPDIQVAEDEVIARLINAAKLIELECVVLDHLGRRVGEKGPPMTGEDLDFVIHLHFSTPKSYDIFSFVTLWNPTPFLHDFGYRPSAENMLTHDDFLSCRSPGADLHLRRLIHGDPSHLPPKFDLFHSLATPVLPPTLGELKIFYMGINWEKLGQQQSRHQTVLNLLDGTGLLRIYGPEMLRGVKVWDGFQSYQRSLPFDGVSVIEEIHKAGICLALSSQPHKDAALMSNRLFEGLAAGALIICDENPWARTHFGDTLLYVDLRDGAEVVAQQITAHIEWARRNPETALALAARAQEIFKRGYIMDASLAQIYSGLQARKGELDARYRARIGDSAVRVAFLAPDPADEAFGRQVAAARAHARQGFQGVVLVDRHDLAAAEAKLAALGGEPGAVEIRGADFFQRDSRGMVVARNRMGPVLKAELQACPEGTLLCFVAPNETVFSNHVAMLAGVLAGDTEADYAWSKAIIQFTNHEGEPQLQVEASLDLVSRDQATPIGLGRFLFRAGRFGTELDLLLDSLDARASSGLALYRKGVPSMRGTLVIDKRDSAHLGIRLDPAVERPVAKELWQEIEVMRDLDPARFDALDVWASRLQSSSLSPDALHIDRLSIPNRRTIVLQLLDALPVPGIVWRAIRKGLRGARRARAGWKSLMRR